MSAVSESRSGWLQQNYEKVLLVALLVGLLISAAILWFKIDQGRSLLAVSGVSVEPRAEQFVQPVDSGRLQEGLQSLREPVQVAARSQRLFVSEIRTTCLRCGKPIGMLDFTCPFCGFEEEPDRDPAKRDSDGDGMPDAWEVQYGFDPMNPDDAHFDADGDGFTNLEEYLAGTDPRDPKSTPDIVTKLRMAEAPRREMLRIRFLSVQEIIEGQKSFQLNVGTRSYFAKIGDLVEGFEMVAYDEAAKSLTVRQGGRQITLPEGREQSDDAFVVRFVLLVDRERTPMVVKMGQEFTVRDVAYRFMDITADGDARIVAVATGKEYRVPMISSREEASTAVTPGGPSDLMEEEMLRMMERDMPRRR